MNNHRILLIVAILSVGSLIFITRSAMKSKLSFSTPSFQPESEIPIQYTCDGANISPALHWAYNGSPEPASYLLIVDDPDANRVVGKTFVHWGALLSPSTTTLPEGISSKKTSALKTIDQSAIELVTDFNAHHYGGPCPPQKGGIHRYQCTLFALNKPIEVIQKMIGTQPLTAKTCHEKLADEIITYAQLTGTYARKE